MNISRSSTVFVSTLLFLGSSLSLADQQAIPQSPSAEGARAYLIAPANGAIVSETFVVKFGLEGMTVAPAGVDKKNTGHHHLLVDTETLPNLTQPLSGDVRHFGAGQTETSLTLPQGTHTLQLVLGNHLHVPHDPPVISEKITITVE